MPTAKQEDPRIAKLRRALAEEGLLLSTMPACSFTVPSSLGDILLPAEPASMLRVVQLARVHFSDNRQTGEHVLIKNRVAPRASLLEMTTRGQGNVVWQDPLHTPDPGDTSKWVRLWKWLEENGQPFIDPDGAQAGAMSAGASATAAQTGAAAAA